MIYKRFISDIEIMNKSFKTAFALVICCLPFFNNAAAQSASPETYLNPIREELVKQWPQNRTINFVFHGHSVPSGYAKTPIVNTLEAYPYQTLVQIKKYYPYAVVNTITTSIGGENSETGAARFERDVLTHQPDVLFIDYALNDRGIGVERAEKAWRKMIEATLARNIKLILCTPTPDLTADISSSTDPLTLQADMIRRLAAEYHVGLADIYAEFKKIYDRGESLTGYMAQNNHPNAKGHQVAISAIVPWIIPVDKAKDFNTYCILIGSYGNSL